MRKKFVIIGLTGAIGSGCSKISQFIANDIPKSKAMLEPDLDQINESIKKHFDFIKEKTDEFNNSYQNAYETTYIGIELNQFFDKKIKKKEPES